MIKRIGAPKIYRKFEERLAAVQSFRPSDCIAGGRLLQWDDLDPSNWLLPVTSVSAAVGVKLFPAGRLLGPPLRPRWAKVAGSVDTTRLCVRVFISQQPMVLFLSAGGFPFGRRCLSSAVKSADAEAPELLSRDFIMSRYF